MDTFRIGSCIGLLLAAILPVVATAQVDFSLNYSDAVQAENGGLAPFPAVIDSPVLDAYAITTESLIVFEDRDGNGFINTGDTFSDYVLGRVEGLVNDGVIVETFLSTGDRQLTFAFEATGTQIGNRFTLDPGGSLRLWFDSKQDKTLTFADWSDGTSFGDGILVQSGIIIGGEGLNDPTVSDNSSTVLFRLIDELSDEFVGADVWQQFVDPVRDLVLQSNVTDQSCFLVTCFSESGIFQDFFGFDIDRNDDGLMDDGRFIFQTRQVGRAVTTAIPAPAPVALIGLGLLAIWIRDRRCTG